MKKILNEADIEHLNDIISESANIVVCCHHSPDGDALGASLGWAEFLRSRGKQPSIIVPDMYPDFLQWLPGTEQIIRYDKRKEQADGIIEAADTIFCLDFNSLGRVGEMQPSLEKAKARKVLIDHHLSPDIDVEMCVSQPTASSTCELIFRVVWELGQFEQMDKKFAADIYCGMMTDTGGFTYNSNDPDIFFIISQLLSKKINKDKIYRNVYNTFSESRLRLMGYVLYEKMVVLPERHAAFYALRKEDLFHFQFVKGDAEGLVNIPLQMKGLKLSISLREDTVKDNLVWVSLRSVDDLPCNEIAERFFNGGGHLNAAGGRVFGSMEEAIERVKLAIEAFSDRLG